ncbi:MAG TPA: phage tail protein [Devosia sp.]|jgi:hypothetical protein|nr:phage tail protein [Devosia sp.]
MTSSLLPQNATPWERAVADAMVPAGAVQSAIGAMRRVKYVSPRPSMLPFLVWEYGLGELTPYVPNLYTLIDEGVRWQRLRGTVSAIAIGLAWIGYTAELEEAWTGRRFWNSFQLRFPELPPRDLPDLERIEGITGLSVPKRSILRRGVHQYDVGPLEGDHSRLDGSMLDVESGIAVTQAGTIWSFGRVHEFEHLMTEAEGLAIGNWVDPVDETGLLWANLNTLWAEANFLWADSPDLQRSAAMAGWFVNRVLWVRLSGADGVIGYRRCRAVHAVLSAPQGAYALGSARYAPAPAGTRLYAEALTQFDDADGVVCTEVALVVNAQLAPGLKPGLLWLEPDQLVEGEPIAVQSVSIPLRRTVRERIKFVVDFDNTLPDPELTFSRSSNSQYLPLLSEAI